VEVICIDSGIMHLARSLGKSYIGLWGGSTPEYIHGEKTGPLDLRVDIECKDKLCMVCPEKHNRCMKDLKPEMVMKALTRGKQKKGGGDAK
jgi:heptosyltransferase-2